MTALMAERLANYQNVMRHSAYRGISIDCDV